MKKWLEGKKITKGYKNPFTGEIQDHRDYVHFFTFSVPLEEANKYESFEELLKAKIK